MNDLEVRWWPIDKPIPYARNARKISSRAVDKVAASIKEFGWRQPIVVDRENLIIVGHARLLAAKKLGLEQVTVHVAENLSPAQVRAYRLMDNRSHEETDWDLDLLRPEISELKDLDFDLSLTGFDGGEIDRVLASLIDDDEKANATPPLPEIAVTQPGDLWLCGKHRALCGDATVALDVQRLFNGVSPALMAADPPYGVQYDPEWRAEAGVNENRSKLGEVRNDDRADWREAWTLFPGDVMYVWHAGKYAATVQQSIEACGFEVRSQIIWAKDRFALRELPLAARAVLVCS